MPPVKRRRITVTASHVGINHAEKSLVRLGFDSKSRFAKSQLMSKSTVDRFFNRQPIQLDSFIRICEGLKIEDWRRVAELEPIVNQCETEASEEAEEPQISKTIVSQFVDMKQTTLRQITVANRKNGEVQFEIVLKGDIDSIDDQVQKTLETILRSLSGNTITITDIQEGSIKIKIQGSPRDIAKLIDRLNSREITEINGFPIEDTLILSQDFLKETEDNIFDRKWSLLRETISNISQGTWMSPPFGSLNLSGADLSDTDLSTSIFNKVVVGVTAPTISRDEYRFIGAILINTDLSGADLSGSNFSRARLRNADLNGATLNITNLSNADLSGANLSNADLSGANLSNADLSGANLSNANLSKVNLKDVIFNEETQILSKWKLVHQLVNQGGADRNLSGVDLSNSYLAMTNLRSANLNGANLSGTILNGANLDNADLRNTNLTHAELFYASVANTQFGSGVGLSESQKLDLRQRGAIFSTPS
jgi:uncharacterized protein YjbI with pentapeptide repeats